MYQNFGIDQTLFLQFVNVARIRREGLRPFRRLTKLDTSVSVTPANMWNTPLVLPADFEYLTEDGLITLFDGNDTFQEIDEVPFNQLVQFKDYSNKFTIDAANQIWYILGLISQNFNAYIFYQADWGDITLTTSWKNIPKRYHMILAFDALAMYQLGVDYDDIGARNANELNRQAEMLYNAMCEWDDNLQRSATTRVDYGSNNQQTAPFTPNQINIH